jgi:hypothetical protein
LNLAASQPNQTMKKLRALCAAAAVALSVSHAHAATRVYLMRGLMELSPGLETIGEMLRARGAVVTLGSWMQRGAFVQDALAHPHDRIIFGGHSMGAQEAFAAGAQLAARGIKARVIGLDPLCTSPRMSPGISGVNIWGNGCMGRPATVAGAQNVLIPGYSHINYCTDPRVQRAFVHYAN